MQARTRTRAHTHTHTHTHKTELPFSPHKVFRAEVHPGRGPSLRWSSEQKGFCCMRQK